MTFKLTDTTSDATVDVKITYKVDVDVSKANVHVIYPTHLDNYSVTRVHIPQGSKFQVGAHWHEDYDEIMRVIKGRAKIRLGNTWRVYTPEDGDILIRRNVIHDLKRADNDAKPGEEDEGDLIMEERSDPVDGSKELFFRHAFSAVGDQAEFGWKFALQQLLLLAYTDNYLSFVPGPASWYLTHGLYAFLKSLAGLLGLQPFHDAYTPKRLAHVRETLEAQRKMKRT